jgi:hypothetical protein
MRKDLWGYVVILLAALVLQYVVELKWSATLALKSAAIVPWMIDIAAYVAFGAAAELVLRARPFRWRLLLLAMIAVVPHVVFEATHGSDPAYPYIGLVLIVPDLAWTMLGAAVAAALMRRRASSS